MNPGRGTAQRPDLRPGYALYLRRRRGGRGPLPYRDYARAVRAYCRLLARRLEGEGMAELPCGLGLVVVAECRRPASRRPVDWGATRRAGATVRDWSPATLGCVLAAPRGAGNAECYGFRCNARLFRRMRRRWAEGTLPFDPPDASCFD